MLRKTFTTSALAFGALITFVGGAHAQKPAATPAPKMGGKMTPAKKMPMRDPKTGKFMKKPGSPTPAPKMGGKMTPARKMPARDPKTGKFMKATPAPKKP